MEPYLTGYHNPGTADEAEPDGDDEHNTALEWHGRGFDRPAMFSQDGDEPGDTGIADREGWLEQHDRMAIASARARAADFSPSVAPPIIKR